MDQRAEINKPRQPPSKRSGIIALFLIVLATAGALFFLHGITGGATSGLKVYVMRFLIIALALGGWFLSQRLISSRAVKSGEIIDGMHELTAGLNQFLHQQPALANGILIASSFFIDLFGIFLIGAGIFGPSLKPFIALFILFIMRQACQGLCALPVPAGMIWRYPGFPSLLVTYGVANDFFFSGHTAVAVLGTIEIAGILPAWCVVAAGVIALLEASVVLILRAHYTMDVFCAMVAAFCASALAGWISFLLS